MRIAESLNEAAEARAKLPPTSTVDMWKAHATEQQALRKELEARRRSDASELAALRERLLVTESEVEAAKAEGQWVKCGHRRMEGELEEERRKQGVATELR